MLTSQNEVFREILKAVVLMREDIGKFVWSFRVHILTSLHPLGSLTRYFTQMLMKNLVLYAWMLSISPGALCLTIVQDMQGKKIPYSLRMKRVMMTVTTTAHRLRTTPMI